MKDITYYRHAQTGIGFRTNKIQYQRIVYIFSFCNDLLFQISFSFLLHHVQMRTKINYFFIITLSPYLQTASNSQNLHISVLNLILKSSDFFLVFVAIPPHNEFNSECSILSRSLSALLIFLLLFFPTGLLFLE